MNKLDQYKNLLYKLYQDTGYQFYTEDIESCMHQAVWIVNKNFDSKTAKYSTYLATIFKRVLYKTYEDLYKSNPTNHLSNLIPSDFNFDRIDFWLDAKTLLNDEYYNILRDRVFSRMTYVELSEKYNISRLNAKEIIDYSVDLLKEKLN